MNTGSDAAVNSVPSADNQYEAETTGPSAKRRRTERKRNYGKKKATQRRCLFGTLPLEILAAILMNCASPKDLLAVARCSRHLCSTLLFEGNAFIWRSVRKNTKPIPMPDPLPIYTEASYAALAFDYGPCDVRFTICLVISSINNLDLIKFCKCHVSEPYASFSLKVRFCFGPECCKELDKKYRLVNCYRTFGEGGLSHFIDWPIKAETAACFLEPEPRPTYWFFSSHTGSTWIPTQGNTPKSEAEWLLNASLAHIAGDAVETSNRTHMKFYVNLWDWVQEYRLLRNTIRKQNKDFAKRQAAFHSWDVWVLKTCKSFASLLEFKTRNFEVISSKGKLFLIRGDVESEMAARLEERRLKRVKASQEKLAQAVSTHYTRLRSLPKNAGRVFPNFSVFKSLPVITSLAQLSPDADFDYGPRLKSDGMIHKLLESQLNEWVDKARNDLGALIGVAGWKPLTKKAVHPVERPNVRFLCTRCESNLDRNLSVIVTPRSLTFKEACEHTCPYVPKKSKTLWDAKWFQVDTKAQNAIKQILPVDFDGPFGTHKPPHDKGDLFLCGSCDAAIVLGFKDIAEHAHRHDAMTVTLLPSYQAPDLLKHPRQVGLTKRLFYGKGPLGKEEQDLKILGCRHCTQSRELLIDDPWNPATPDPEKALKQPNPLPVVKTSFNGMRSHLKSKHGVVIRDEDFFRYPPDSS
ncbi:hypothetical protein ONZ45_g10648 [Pleurotus djamor]|nr:hypothetical protein ONZ45_g10648 [Pleurotus djamor]